MTKVNDKTLYRYLKETGSSYGALKLAFKNKFGQEYHDRKKYIIFKKYYKVIFTLVGDIEHNREMFWENKENFYNDVKAFNLDPNHADRIWEEIMQQTTISFLNENEIIR